MDEIKKYYPIETGAKGELRISLVFVADGKNGKGIYLRVGTVKREPHSESFHLYGDITENDYESGVIILKPLNRKSSKAFTLLSEKVNFDGIAKLWLKKEYKQAMEMIRPIKEG